MPSYPYVVGADAVAVTAARKTVLQLAIPAGIHISTFAVDLTFDGTSPSAVPVLVTLERQASAGTGGVAITAGWGPNPLDPNLPATTVTALKGPWATTEPVMTSIYKSWRISPTSGVLYPLSLDQEPVCPASSWIGLVVNAAAAVNVTAHLAWYQ